MAQTQDDAVIAEKDPDTTDILEDGKTDPKPDPARSRPVPKKS